MIKTPDNTYCPIYEYIYLFVMVIYMGQMTPDTGRMVGGLSGLSMPFLIPIAMTFILVLRHPINFAHKRLIYLCGVMFCWSVAVCYKINDFSNSNLSYYFFLFYAIIIAYIHVRIYGRDLFPVYEHIMVVLSAVALVLWGMHVLLPFTDSIFQAFPRTRQGHNVFYLFHWISENRNAGCSWEPGRFAIMIIPAIVVNLSRRGITFKHNKGILVLLGALASTMSTTGYSIAVLLYGIFWFEKVTVKKSLAFIVFVLPIFVYIFSLDFMTEKIEDRANFKDLNEERFDEFDYYEEKNRDEYVGSLDRFESASFEWINFQEEPLLGYGRNRDYSWFRQEITQNFELTGGLVKTLSQYGIFVGLLLYIILFFSSFKISRLFRHGHSVAFALALLLCSVSYVVFTVPLFTAFWFYGLFCFKSDVEESRILISRRKHRYSKRYLQ